MRRRAVHLLRGIGEVAPGRRGGRPIPRLRGEFPLAGGPVGRLADFVF
ncbi:MAG: hypothetical protein MPW17_19755 [Candidatus Manganitrophus sp.]|nr:MAG: hypothetical protein MPW17_19755 [Candidatus Manganitrophus sp.]